MANTAGTGSSFTGTASADIIVAEETGITGATTDTINGLAGNDVIFGDHDELFVDAGAGNATIGTAIDINDETLWSTKANPDVGDTSVPYTSVLATGANELDYFKVTVGAGQTITVDLDYGFGPYGGPSFDSVVRLVDINGGELAYNDDSDITEGGRGSSPITGTLSRDSYFTFTNTGGLALNYFIEVGRFNGEGLPGDVVTSGATYMLNVSVTGHANTNIAAFSADIINGGDDNDILYGLDGDDTINGGAGDDLIIGGAGADAIDGGTGTDTLSYEDASAGVRSGEGALIQDGDAQGDTLTSIENYIGSQFNDILSDFDANEANVIYGLGGDDSLRGLTGQDQLFGGDGDDTLQISDGEAEAGEVYDGGAQNFFDQLALFGNGSSDFDFTTSTVVDIEQLNFVAQLGGGATAHFLASQINGGINRYVADARVGVGQAVTVDIFMGTETALDLSGASVTAFTYAGDGFVITGDDSSETIRGTSVNDTLNGNSGDDVLEGGPGADAINGGAGLNDTASYEHSSAGVTVVVGGAISGGDAAGDTLSGIENLTGSNSDDILAIGGSGDNILRGLGGRDVLVGDGGQDQVFGGAGDDELQIQSGDVVAGEVYDGGTQDNFDQLTFFSNSVADVYDFRATTVTGIERLYFSNNVGGGASIQFDAAQIKGGIGLFFAEERTGSNNQIVIQIDMGTETTLDLSGASIGGFTYAGDGFAVTGDAASETITGSSVDDTLEGGAGGDNLNGSTGNDTASYAGSATGVNVQLQYHVASGGDAAGDTLTSIENLNGSGQNDTLIGDPGVNRLVGNNGNDVLKGLNGADQLLGGGGDDWLYVDNLDTQAHGGTGIDRLIVVNGNGVTNAVGAKGIEIATGNAGNDTFDGTGATENLTLRGLAGDDALTGGSGDDFLFGGSGADQLVGGIGLDRLFIDENDTVVDGGGGTEDRVIVQQLASAATGVTVDMGASNVEVAFGNLKNDTFDGSSSTVALSLYGRQGQDTLIGGAANDRLFGDNNDTAAGDILNGGLGNDFLRGGLNGAGGFAERDQFVFDDQWGNDRIFDFANNGAEKIDFNSITGITQRSDLTITDGAGFALISYHDAVGGWDASIRVDGVTAAQLQDNDFIYV